MAWENFETPCLTRMKRWRVSKTHKEGTRHKHKNCTCKTRRENTTFEA